MDRRTRKKKRKKGRKKMQVIKTDNTIIYADCIWFETTNVIVDKDDETFKLNFRDGLERLAGLSNYAKRYEISSEILHSTPLLIYSNKEYFYYMTLLIMSFVLSHFLMIVLSQVKRMY